MGFKERYSLVSRGHTLSHNDVSTLYAFILYEQKHTSLYAVKVINNLTSANGAVASIANISIAPIESTRMKSPNRWLGQTHLHFNEKPHHWLSLPLFSNERHRSSATYVRIQWAPGSHNR